LPSPNGWPNRGGEPHSLHAAADHDQEEHLRVGGSFATC
jgi:hypothetical protein